MDLTSILKDCKIVRVANAAAAGTTDLSGTAVDTRGYDGVCFVYGVGTLTANQVTSLKVEASDASGMGGAADITGAATSALTDSDGNKLLVVDVRRPAKRYLRSVLLRETANAVVDFGIAILYRAVSKPVTADATVGASAGVTAS